MVYDWAQTPYYTSMQWRKNTSLYWPCSQRQMWWADCTVVRPLLPACSTHLCSPTLKPSYGWTSRNTGQSTEWQTEMRVSTKAYGFIWSKFKRKRTTVTHALVLIGGLWCADRSGAKHPWPTEFNLTKRGNRNKTHKHSKWYDPTQNQMINKSVLPNQNHQTQSLGVKPNIKL